MISLLLYNLLIRYYLLFVIYQMYLNFPLCYMKLLIYIYIYIYYGDSLNEVTDG